MRRLPLSALVLLLGFAASSSEGATFKPVPLTTDSLNADLIVEKTAPAPLMPATSATMESGLLNTGATWYERGYNLDFPSTGLPPAGSAFTGELSDHTYALAPSFQSNNVLLLDASVASGSLVPTTPVACAAISLLVSSDTGGVVELTIHHENGALQTETVSCPHWLGGADPLFTAWGRVDSRTFFFIGVNSSDPRLYHRDFVLNESNAPVTRIDFTHQSGNSRTVLFALSGASAGGEPFIPIPVTGFNADIVVEANANRPGFLAACTTATMESGVANTRRTWYEQGYFLLDTNTGWPAAGSTLTNSGFPDHAFLLPASYEQNNAALIDWANPNATLTLETPTAYSALAFLTAAGNGPVSVGCVISFSDGTSVTNSFVSPDWHDSSPAFCRPRGAVHLGTRLVDCFPADPVGLFAVDMPQLSINQDQRIQTILLGFLEGGPEAHAAVFALGGASLADGTRPAVSIARGLDGSVTLTSDVSGRLQAAAQLNGSETDWQDEGAITANVARPVSLEVSNRFFRVERQ